MEQKEQSINPELIDDRENNDLIPSMNVNMPALKEEEKKELIKDEKLLNVYDEVLDDLRNDRKEISELLDVFANMVINEGESSGATKEAVVNLIKAKSDVADKKSKIADLMTRVKLKERDTFPRYLAAKQHNEITVNQNKELTKEEKKALIRSLNEKKKKVQNEKNQF